jgi:hypothetical protein
MSWNGVVPAARYRCVSQLARAMYSGLGELVRDHSEAVLAGVRGWRRACEAVAGGGRRTEPPAQPSFEQQLILAI